MSDGLRGLGFSLQHIPVIPPTDKAKAHCKQNQKLHDNGLSSITRTRQVITTA